MTRGALFRHLPSKLALGYAVVDEHIRDGIAHGWIAPLIEAEDPVGALVARRDGSPTTSIAGT